MKKIATNTLKSGSARLTLALMITLLIMTTPVPSFAQQVHVRVDYVPAHSTNTYHWTFVGRELEVLAVSGDGDSDLDLYVYDEYGHLVGKDDDDSDDCLVVFTPRWTGTFTIKVVNRGGYGNKYRIGTN